MAKATRRRKKTAARKPRKAARKAPRKARKNPYRTAEGRVLHPENVSGKTVQKILHLRRKQRAAHQRLTRRIGKRGTFQSAELALQLGKKSGKRRAAKKTPRKASRIRGSESRSTKGTFATILDNLSNIKQYYAPTAR